MIHTEPTRQPVHQLPVSHPPRRGLPVRPAGGDASPKQSAGADLPPQLRQEGRLAPGTASSFLEDVRLQQGTDSYHSWFIKESIVYKLYTISSYLYPSKLTCKYIVQSSIQ